MIVNCWIEIPINCKFPYYVLILINKKIQLNVSFCCYQIKCVGVGGAWNTANVHSGSTVAIFGLGVVGLAVSFLFFLFPPPPPLLSFFVNVNFNSFNFFNSIFSAFLLFKASNYGARLQNRWPCTEKEK